MHSEYIIYGILAGIGAAISFGPAFFTITETSIQKGFLNGVFVSVGISISDIMYCTLFIFGLDRFFTDELFRIAGSLIGGAVLLGFGINHILNSKKLTRIEVNTIRSWHQNILKGFVVNSFNPYVPIFWAGVVTTAGVNIPKGAIALFFGAMLTTTVSFDILKSWIASRFRNVGDRNFTRWIQVVVGLLFLILGLYLLASAFVRLF